MRRRRRHASFDYHETAVYLVDTQRHTDGEKREEEREQEKELQGVLFRMKFFVCDGGMESMRERMMMRGECRTHEEDAHKFSIPLLLLPIYTCSL